MYWATGVEPTKLIAWTRGSISRVSTTSLSPLTTLKTPSGRPASFSNSAIRSENVGTFSDGLSTNVLPQAIATGHIHMGTMAGKLNGVMPAHTPKGWRIDQESKPRPTFSEKAPFNSSGMPHANSTTSMPRVSSPRASSSTLPWSVMMRSTNASKCCSTSVLKRNRTRARESAGVAAHPEKAVWAAAMTPSTSAFEANGTRARTSPVAGLKTSPNRPLVPSVSAPLTK